MRRLLALALIIAALPLSAQAAGLTYVGNVGAPARTPAVRENRIATHESQQRIDRQADAQKQRTRDMQRDVQQNNKR